MVLSKVKGSSYERKVAKQIGTWMFNDIEMVWRESTSGMRKIVYKGDIVPVKAHEFPWTSWPFLFEVKTGYKDHIPTLIKQTKLREWILKLLDELDDKQIFPMLVAQFHSQHPILITTLMFNFQTDICLLQLYQNQYIPFYVYNWNDILNTNFYKICPEILTNMIQTRETKIDNAYKVDKVLTANQRRNEKNATPKKPPKEPKEPPSKYRGIEHLLGDILDAT